MPISAVVMVIRLPFLDVYYVSRYDFLVSPTFFWVEFLIITHIHTCTQMTRTCTCICPFPSVVKVTRYPFAFDTLHEKIGFYGDYIHKFSLQLQLLCALFFQHLWLKHLWWRFPWVHWLYSVHSCWCSCSSMILIVLSPPSYRHGSVSGVLLTVFISALWAVWR